MAEINNTKSNTLLTGTSDDDSIQNGGWWDDGFWQGGGSNVTINTGAGKDSVLNYGSSVTINTSEGKDSVLNWGNFVTINTGAGNDSVRNYPNSGKSVIINTGTGNDSVWNDGSSVTINTGTGNDTIYNNSSPRYDGSIYYYDNDDGSNVLFKYSSGDGNDIITGFKDNSTLSIGGGSYSTTTSGDDVIVTVGKGKISLIGAASLSAVNIVGEETKTETNTWKLDGTTATYGTASKTLIKVTGVKSLDGISLSGKVVTIAASSLNKKKVTLTGSGYTLKLADDVTKPTTKKAAFSLSGSTAIYKSSYKTAGYKLASNGKSISYTAATTAKGLATIQGAKSTKGLSIDDGIITLKNAALSKKVTVSGNLDFNFASDYNNATISGTSNDDLISSSGKNLSINGGEGNDWFRIRGSKVAINGGDGDDKIENFASEGTIIGGAGDDSISNGIPGSGDKSSIDGGDGNDYIFNYSEEVTINGGNGFDSIENAYSSVIINGGNDNDSIYNYGSNITINGGKGNDSIFNDELDTGDGSNVLFKYSSGNGNDLIQGFRADSTLSIGGEYSTTKSGKNIIVTVGDGKISLIGAASLGSSLNIAGTKKVTTPATLLTVTNSTKSPVTVGSAVKVINASSRTKAVKITGNKLANSIAGGSGNDTLNGGKGNDTLTGGKGKDIFVYSAGKDVITDYTAEDKISITSGTAEVTTGGDDVIFTVGSGKITVTGGKDKTITYSDSSGKNKKYEYEEETADDEIITLPKTYSKESYTMGNGVFTLDASAVRLDLNVVGNKFANSIIGSDQNDTLEGGKANDTLTGGDGADVFVYSTGDGQDTITDYDADDIISIGSGNIDDISVSGKDVVFKIGNGKITVKNAKNKVISYVDASGNPATYPQTVIVSGTTASLTESYMNDSFNAADYNSSIRTIDATAVLHDVEIIGNKLANSIIGSENNETISGGDGNDTLTGGEGSDVFLYNSGDGNDIITDYAEEDKISIASGSISTVKKSGSNVIFTVGSNKIMVADAASKTITYIDKSGKTKYFPKPPESDIIMTDDNKTAILRETYSDSTYTATSSIIKIDASSVTRDLTITGNSNANIILGGSEDDTIYGGKGNDTLQGGSGADFFVYANGDGNDRIVDYDENDTIKITKGTIKSKKTSGDDVIFTIGSGKITVLGAASKTVSYIEGGKSKTYGTASNVLEDDNFIGGNDLSLLVKSKAADYFAVQESLIQKKNQLPSVTYSSKK